MEKDRRYWIIVASKDHVKSAIQQGIAQTCHGKTAPLKRMKKGDLVLFYSGKETMGNPAKCQEFTAIGKVEDEEVYSVQITENFCPARRKVYFYNSEDISILPLIDDLSFIQNKKKWGFPFRFGFFEINKHDYSIIASKMLNEKTCQIK
ncbi:EVE domain-containing protein [Marivirga lumbricoides]|uniref:UPF0310 protein C9994_13195 n=1 Tax=Marivirga lumbricoides TaxID=1046115 RepID=A0A2T4DHG7_9BACT|nr:EVE domain-containing protein [Marivirga lumbricoides]